jgi:phosphoribosylformylglycinamidine cyclo-ligase
MSKPDQRVEAYNTDQPFLERIQSAVERTRLTPEQEPRLRFHPDGSYTLAAERTRDSADTIGTKADLHWQARTFTAAAQDAFAMNANDLYRDRCEPLKLNNVIMIEREDEEAIAELTEGLSDLSRARGVQMGDGETAILDTMPGFELAVAMTGVPVDDAENRYRPGDVLIGIPSNGIHSNGLTDARRLFGAEWPRELLNPTRIYDEVPTLLKKLGPGVHGLTHVTGGGLSKLRDPELDFLIEETHLTGSSMIFHDVYGRWLAEAGDEAWVDRKMHLKFNSGIGFVVGCPPSMTAEVLGWVPDACEIGYVQMGRGRVIIPRSDYTGNRVEL